MGGRTETPGGNGPAPESYAKVLANLGSVLAALLGLGLVIASGTRPTPRAVVAPKPAVVAAVPPAATRPSAKPRSAPTPVAAPAPVSEPPKLDTVAVARAEEALDALSRDRARAEARAEDAARRLAEASRRAASDASTAKTLAFRVRDPGPKIAQAAARGGFLRAERDKLKTEVARLATFPRPKAKVLSNKNPVARPSDGDEHHFEVRRNRVSSIDLDRLLKLVKADAQLRIRLSDGARLVDNRVGPVGAFSLQYILGRSLPAGLEGLVERRGLTYDLRGWEVIPEFEGRGETFESTRQPISEFARTVNRLNPLKATITLWVYPDGFDLYRKLRDDLQARGFLVAARPLPEGMAIRGSPGGSLSAGQ